MGGVPKYAHEMDTPATQVRDPDRRDLVRLGTSVTLGGDLAVVRETFHLTRNAQAHLIGVTPDALRRWETGDQGMNTESALRVGEWYWGAMRVLDNLQLDGIDIRDLVPCTTAAQYLGVSVLEISEKCQSGGLRCEDLGVLGLYVYRSCVPTLPEE